MKSNIFITALFILSFVSCRHNESLSGFHSAAVKFSSHEIQHIALALLEDSTFYYISRTNEGMPWRLQSGHWTMIGGDVLLKGYDQFNLWLRPVKNQLELLDFEANAVISGKAVRLTKTSDPLWDKEISVAMTGKLVDIEGKKFFLPCNSFQFIPLQGDVSAVEAFNSQAVALMLTFVPSKLAGHQHLGFRITNVFGPSSCGYGDSNL